MKTPRRTMRTIDWQAVRDRLSRAAQASEEAHRLSPERVRAVLEERARAAARVPAPSPEAGDVTEIVRFVLGGECYAIETAYVREILRFKEFVPLPDTPGFLVGVINLRGQIVAVMDLRQFFAIPPQPSTDSSRVIVLGQERLEFGLLADAVHEVALLQLDEIREAPGSVASSARDYLRGVTADACLVLDGAALLSDPRLYIDLGDEGAPAPVLHKS